MPDQSQHVYVIQSRGQRDYTDCQAAVAHVPARMTALPFMGGGVRAGGGAPGEVTLPELLVRELDDQLQRAIGGG
jgi:hypothetical protein